MHEKEKSDYFKMSLKEEDEITKKTLSQFKIEFEFYERSLNLLYDVITYLSKSTKSMPLSGSKTVIFAMLPRIIGTMQSMRILNLKGYYYDERILGRSILENFGLCAYFARNEKEARNWLEGKEVKIPKIKLYNEFASFLTGKKEKGGEAEYGKLSCFVHGGAQAIVSSFLTRPRKAKFNEGRIDIMFPPFFSEKDVAPLEIFPMALLVIVMKVFKDELGNKWIEKIRNILIEYKKYAKST